MTNLPDLSKATPGPWEAKYVAGAGFEIHAPIHLTKCVEYPRPPTGPAMVYTCVERPNPFLIACDRWVQFEPNGWHEMQEANAALIARAPELAARVEELTEDIADHKQIIEDKRERNKELRAHNARLRGLLRECVEFLPMALQATIYEELGQ